MSATKEFLLLFKTVSKKNCFIITLSNTRAYSERSSEIETNPYINFPMMCLHISHV